ncbi:hypothetical protein D3C80_1581140 [compost metagenome]
MFVQRRFKPHCLGKARKNPPGIATPMHRLHDCICVLHIGYWLPAIGEQVDVHPFEPVGRRQHVITHFTRSAAIDVHGDHQIQGFECTSKSLLTANREQGITAEDDQCLDIAVLDKISEQCSWHCSKTDGIRKLQKAHGRFHLLGRPVRWETAQ